MVSTDLQFGIYIYFEDFVSPSWAHCCDVLKFETFYLKMKSLNNYHLLIFGVSWSKEVLKYIILKPGYKYNIEIMHSVTNPTQTAKPYLWYLYPIDIYNLCT